MTHMLIRTISEIARANNTLCFSNAVSSLLGNSVTHFVDNSILTTNSFYQNTTKPLGGIQLIKSNLQTLYDTSSQTKEVQSINWSS